MSLVSLKLVFNFHLFKCNALFLKIRQIDVIQFHDFFNYCACSRDAVQKIRQISAYQFHEFLKPLQF